MQLTSKQFELMRVIVAGNEDGTSIDLDQIVDRASHKPTKQSLQFSLRSLIGHGLIEKASYEIRRDRQHAVIKPTNAGLAVMGKSSVKTESTIPDDLEDLYETDIEDVFES